MINFQIFYHRMLNLFIGLLLLSLLMAADPIHLWDLGVKIESKAPAEYSNTQTINMNENKKYAALTQRHVGPKLVNVELLSQDVNLMRHSISTLSTLNDQQQYDLGKKYFISGRYVDAIKFLEMVDFNQLSDNQKINMINLHADALFNLGYYSRIVNILTHHNEYTLNDELLFILGMSATKIGDKGIALNAFNDIIEQHLDSEYQNIAKLQRIVLSR